MTLFAKSPSLDDAHRLSALVFGAQQARHFTVGAEREEFHSGASVYDAPPIEYVLQTGTLRGKTRQMRGTSDADRGGENVLSGIRAQIPEKERKLREQERKLEESGVELRDAIRELDNINAFAELGEAHGRYVSVLRQPESGAAENAERVKREESFVKAALGQRKRQIENALGKLRQTESAQNDYNDVCEALDRAESERRTRENTLRDALETERQERSNLMESFAVWRQRNERLQFPPEDWQAIRQALAAYREPSDWTPIQKAADDRARQTGDALRKEQRRGFSERLCKVAP